MANEIQVGVTFAANKNGVAVNTANSKTADMAGDQMITNVQIIGTSAEAIVLGDVSTVGYVKFVNMDATNYIDISLIADGTTPFAKLLAGDVTIIKVATATMYAKSNTANCNLLVQACEL